MLKFILEHTKLKLLISFKTCIPLNARANMNCQILIDKFPSPGTDGIRREPGGDNRDGTRARFRLLVGVASF